MSHYQQANIVHLHMIPSTVSFLWFVCGRNFAGFRKKITAQFLEHCRKGHTICTSTPIFTVTGHTSVFLPLWCTSRLLVVVFALLADVCQCLCSLSLSVSLQECVIHPTTLSVPVLLCLVRRFLSVCLSTSWCICSVFLINMPKWLFCFFYLNKSQLWPSFI